MQKNDKTKEREDQVENKRGDRKGESNDSPEIPDRRKPSDIPGLLLKKRRLQCYWAIQRSWFARVNAHCNLSRKKSREVAAHFRADCFMLCITAEVEHKIAMLYKCQYCCSCKNYRGKGMVGGKNASLRRFLADQKIVSS